MTTVDDNSYPERVLQIMEKGSGDDIDPKENSITNIQDIGQNFYAVISPACLVRHQKHVNPGGGRRLFLDLVS